MFNQLKTMGFVCFLAVVCGLAVAGCKDGGGGGSAEQEESYALCGGELSHGQVVDIFNGNLVFVGSYSENGYSSSELIAGLVLSIVLNGIDFANLADYTFTFDDDLGFYVMGDGDTQVGFYLTFAGDYGDFVDGDPIPYNFFDYESWVTNVQVDLDGMDLVFDYDPGPLHDLVDGEVDFDGDLNGFSVEFDIKTHLVAFEVESSQTYPGSWPWNADDRLTLEMATTRAVFDDFVDQLEGGGYGLDYAGTFYDSVLFDLEQEFSEALFLMQHQGNDWYWEGDYMSQVDKHGMSLYQLGFVSNIEQNTTEYYCDEARTDYIGVARHDLDLEGGVFEFADGTEVDFGLGAY